MTERARVHLVVGPVGAGKSTYAARLAETERALRLTLDEWMTRLFSADRPRAGVVPWYVARAGRCIEQIWRVAVPLLGLDTAVVLEIGLLSRGERESFYRRVDDAGFHLSIHVLDAAREVRRERVMARNETRGSTFSNHVPPDVFEFASDLWEPPGADECEGRDVRFIRTDMPS